MGTIKLYNDWEERAKEKIKILLVDRLIQRLSTNQIKGIKKLIYRSRVIEINKIFTIYEYDVGDLK